jgi:hypothetical protein
MGIINSCTECLIKIVASDVKTVAIFLHSQVSTSTCLLTEMVVQQRLLSLLLQSLEGSSPTGSE